PVETGRERPLPCLASAIGAGDDRRFVDFATKQRHKILLSRTDGHERRVDHSKMPALIAGGLRRTAAGAFAASPAPARDRPPQDCLPPTPEARPGRPVGNKPALS